MEARETRYEQTSTRVVRPEHLIAIALQTNRAKDAERVRLLKECAAVDLAYLGAVLARHGLDG